ncbi:MAG: hypothetical protein WDO73_03980 [Ignavibacteriota bacterium]
MQPLQQPALQIALAQPYPVAIAGVLKLSFNPGGANPIDDPSIQFSTGGRSAPFTIPANALQATFSAPQFAVQTGSVQGTITVSVDSLQANGAPIPVPSGLSQTVAIAAAAPSISNIAVVQTAGGIQVQIAGVADTRELTQAVVSFQAAAGTTIQTQQITVPLNTPAAAWFASVTAAPVRWTVQPDAAVQLQRQRVFKFGVGHIVEHGGKFASGIGQLLVGVSLRTLYCMISCDNYPQ